MWTRDAVLCAPVLRARYPLPAARATPHSSLERAMRCSRILGALCPIMVDPAHFDAARAVVRAFNAVEPTRDPTMYGTLPMIEAREVGDLWPLRGACKRK